jgi:uncharacterized protein YukE
MLLTSNERSDMTRIRLDTEYVRTVGRRLLADGSRLEGVGRDLGSAVGALDTALWEGMSRARAEPLLRSVRPKSVTLAEGLARLGLALLRVAEVFEEEDATAARDVTGLPWVDWESSPGFPAAGGNPDDEDDNPKFNAVIGGLGARYALFEGVLFATGEGDTDAVDPDDVSQGRVGDCYLLASLAAIASQEPDLIREIVQDNGDGTYTVTLYERESLFTSTLVPTEVQVTSELPLRRGRPVFARAGDVVGEQPELWPALVEKAYARTHGGYNGIQGGWAHLAMEELTGVESQVIRMGEASVEDLAAHFDGGAALTATTLHDRGIQIGGLMLWDIPDPSDKHPLFVDGTLVEDHEYYLTGVDAQAGTVSLRNPWGWHHGEVTLTYDEFLGAFQRVSLNSLAAE